MGQKCLWIYFFVLLSVVRGQSGRRWTSDTDERRISTETNGYAGNQFNSQRPNQPFGQFNSNNRETEHTGSRPNTQSFSERPTTSHTNNRESEYSQRPNQQQFSSNREQNKPFGLFGQGSNNRETDHSGNRPNTQSFSNERPNQQHSTSHTNNRETEYNQQQSSNNRDREPNKPFGLFGQTINTEEPVLGGNRPNIQSNQRPNQQGSFGSSNNRETEYNQGLNQQQFGNNRDRERPNQQFGSFGQGNREPVLGGNRPNTQSNQRPNQQGSFGSSNNRETEYNQGLNQQQFGNNRDRERPNQQLGSFGQGNREPVLGGNRPNTQSNQRPNQQGNFGSSNNRETEYNQGLNQQQSGNNREPILGGNRPNTQSSSNQRPNQQGNFGNADRPGGNQFAQRPPSMGSLQPEGSKPLCYGFFGCYSQSEPWTSKLRPIPAPLPPENNSASFFFYSRPTIEQRYLINVFPEFSLGEAKFDPRRPTVIIIHGFIQDGNELWMEEMKNAYLRHVDANALIVDWGKGSRRLSYLQAAGNTRLIGSMISFLIKRLMEGHGADPSTFHIIGHSLGAHVASYAGKEVPGIGRITALDPAQPGFEGFDKSVRLDKSDAQFVDVVHTNAKPFIPTLGLGMIKPHGHVDFYLNGGFDQPLCVSPPKNGINDIKSILDLANLPIDWFSQTFFCDHARAHSYLTEAFNNTDCVFWGHKASLKTVAQGVANTLTQGLLAKYVALSSSCSTDNCVPMGFNTQQSQLRGSFVVTTNGQFPYCRPEKGIPSRRENTQTSNNRRP